MDRLDLSDYDWCSEPLTKLRNVRRVTPQPRKICNFTGRTRIGSPSANGEVFLIDSKSVIKVIPYDKGRSELEYAEEASTLVKEGLSPFFPIVYQFGKCKDTIYRQDSKLLGRTLFYVKKKLLSYYIMSERAWGDLQQLYRAYKLERVNMAIADWKAVVRQILDAIIDIQKYLKIMHNDIKFENILVKSISPLQILLHDFGESGPLSHNDRTHDVTTLFNILARKEYLPEEIKNLATKSEKFVKRYAKRHSTRKDFIEKVRNKFWEG